MATQVDIHDAKTHLSELLKRVMNGERIIIAISGQPVAILTPFEAAPETRVPGNDVGQVIIADDFDTLLTGL